jgi:hypothetical protein
MASGESAPLLGNKKASPLRTTSYPMVFPSGQGHGSKAGSDHYTSFDISETADRTLRDYLIRYDRAVF